MDQMRYLEDTIIVLSELDDRSIEYKKRREVVQKIKWKRKKIVKSSGDDKDSIEVKREEKCRSSRLEILKRKNQQKQEKSDKGKQSQPSDGEIVQNLEGLMNDEHKNNESN